jgi:hypothetical protein
MGEAASSISFFDSAPEEGNVLQCAGEALPEENAVCAAVRTGNSMDSNPGRVARVPGCEFIH